MADIRKYGFTLVTVLLTANALVTTDNTKVDRPAASIVVMALLFALFMLDNYYWALLRATVERAKALEAISTSGFQLSRSIGEQVNRTHATELVLAVYGLFVLVAAVIGLTGGTNAPTVAIGWLLAVMGIGIIDLVGMFATFLVVQREAPPSKWFLRTVVRRGKPHDTARAP